MSRYLDLLWFKEGGSSADGLGLVGRARIAWWPSFNYSRSPDYVFSDLQAEAGMVEPILQVDDIRYIYIFRNLVRLFVPYLSLSFSRFLSSFFAWRMRRWAGDGMFLAHERVAALNAAPAGTLYGYTNHHDRPGC